ncbi:MAG: DMT family transporter [Oceanobacter sp.]
MTQNLKAGALFLLFGEAMLAIMGAIIKHLSDDLTTEQIVFFRNLMGLVVLAPLLIRSGPDILKTQVWHWHLMRGVVGVAAMFCYFWALANMALTEAFLVKLSSPFFMPLIALWWLKEPSGKYSWLSLAIGFSGVAIILLPGTDQVSGFNIAAVVGLIGAALAALAKVTIRRMSETEPSQRIVFYFGVIASLVSLPPALISWEPVPVEAWIWILALGAVATLGQLAMTRAYRIAPTGKVGVYVYSALIYGALMGWLIWDEVPALTTWLGAALIIAAGMVNLRGNRAS